MKPDLGIRILALSGVAGVVALYLLPFAALVALATTDAQLGLADVHYVGIGNFALLVRDQTFWRALVNSGLFVLIVMPAALALGFASASLLLRQGRVTAVLRGLNFLPFMATMTAMAVVWDMMLNPVIGPLQPVFRLLGLDGVNWLHDPVTALPTLALVMTWRLAGLATTLFTAALTRIPDRLYQAAALDGAASPYRRFAVVTWPAIRQPAAFAGLVVTIRTLETFDLIRVLTQGGPSGTTDTLLYALYRESFDFLRLGYGAALSLVFLALVGGLALLQSRLSASAA